LPRLEATTLPSILLSLPIAGETKSSKKSVKSGGHKKGRGGEEKKKRTRAFECANAGQLARSSAHHARRPIRTVGWRPPLQSIKAMDAPACHNAQSSTLRYVIDVLAHDYKAVSSPASDCDCVSCPLPPKCRLLVSNHRNCSGLQRKLGTKAANSFAKTVFLAMFRVIFSQQNSFIGSLNCPQIVIEKNWFRILEFRRNWGF
jgi:hypothetical protein